MAIYKCKMCGADLPLEENMTVCECEYCGTTQTVPTADNDKKMNLFNRANRLRFANEFDKAAGVFESIVSEFPEEAEGYWGLCLCKYGIEYVDDPATAKKIPTCHRTSYDSIFDDSNFEMAQEYADVVARKVYRDEAKEIDRLQKSILEIAKNEEPFDIFICYKETANDGQRTIDSVLAQDIYDNLTEKGYKVFFARITLEDKLGQEYEPYIFSALSSAKVMLVIGTDYEYFNAVWVKNEWSRFLDMMKSDKKKTLIPCYKDIDAYDIPNEFRHLQAQDMGKVGFVQDLIRGIGKIIPIAAPSQTQNTVVIQQNYQSAGLLDRAFLFLEEGQWDKANEYLEKVLDLEPKNAKAYVGKLLADRKLRTQAELHFSNSENADELFTNPIENNENYKKALRFADAQLKSELERYAADNHNEKQRRIEAAEDQKKEDIYASLVQQFDSIDSVSGYCDYIKRLERLDGYKDSAGYIQLAQDKINETAPANYQEAEIAEASGDYAGAGLLFGQISGYKDSSLRSTVNQIKRTGKCDTSAFDYQDNDWSDIISIACAYYFMVGLKKDGTVVAVGDNSKGQCDVSSWRDIVSVSCGDNFTVGLKKDGTVVAVGNNSEGQCDVSSWRDIISIACKYDNTIGLKKDGTVVAVGDNTSGQCDVSGWRDIVSIDCAFEHTVGLKKDGTVVAVGIDEDDHYIVSNWRNIVSIACGDYCIVGLRKNGTVVAVGDNEEGQCDVSGWRDIVSVSCGDNYIVGLKKDGTVVAVGNNEEGECNVSDWRDIVSISCGYNKVGLKKDGTVVTVGDNVYGRCNVSDWRDIVITVGVFSYTVGLKKDGTVVASTDSIFQSCDVYDWKDIVSIARGDYHTVGLKKDGTVVAVGRNDDGQCDVTGWRDIVSIACGDDHTVGLKKDGTVVAVGRNDGQCDVTGWRDIVSISCGYIHTVGLKRDGTVVAVGNNGCSQCDVANWRDIVSIDCGGCHTVGLNKDGTVIAVGENEEGQCNVSKWKDIVSISCRECTTIGITRNGEIVRTDSGYKCEPFSQEVVSVLCDVFNEATAKMEQEQENQHIEQEEKEYQLHNQEQRRLLEQKAQQRKQRINNLTMTIAAKRTELSNVDSTLSTLHTNLQQQQSIYNANAGKLFGKSKAQAAQAEINRLNAEISTAEQKKSRLEAQLAKLEAEMKELESQN